MKPREPILPRGILPRSLWADISHNLSSNVRQWRGKYLTAFDDLRALSGFEPVQACMADIKGQIRGMSWQVRVREDFKDSKDTLADEVALIRAVLRYPDPSADLDFRAWVDRAVDEILVTDALSVLPRFTLRGDPASLELVDGSTIRPLVDDRGRMPTGEEDAYWQVVNGLPETAFRMRELWYLPMNRRSDAPFGMSCTERVVITINLALRAALHDLSYYTHGTIPDSLYEMPAGITPKGLREYQKVWDDLMMGRDDRRVGGMRFVPGGGKYIPTKTREFKYEFREYLDRVICWAFGVSPIPIAKMMNRATSRQLEESTLESGIRPVANFIADVLNRWIERAWGIPEVEFAWGRDEIEDPTVVYERNIAYAHGGLRTFDSVLQEVGEKPVGLDTPVIVTAVGTVVFVEDLIAEREEKRRAREKAAQAASVGPAGPLQGPRQARDGSSQEEFGAQAGPGGAPKGPSMRMQAAARDLVKWSRMAERRTREGRNVRKFRSGLIPASIRFEIERGLTRDRSLPALRALFRAAARRLVTLAKADPSPAGQLAAQERLTAVLQAALSGLLPGILTWAQEQLGFESEVVVRSTSGTVRKQRGEGPPLDFSGIVEEIEASLLEATTAGLEDAAASIGGVLGTPPERAIQYARDRAAEMVGMRRLDDGTLVENPDARFAIDDVMRADINAKVTAAVEQGWSPQRLRADLTDLLGFSRAETVARTETAHAYGNAAAEFYKESEVAHVEILDGDGCLPQGHLDGAPSPDGVVGIIQTDREANGQVWTVEQYQTNLTGHPRCVRAAIAFIPEED